MRVLLTALPGFSRDQEEQLKLLNITSNLSFQQVNLILEHFGYSGAYTTDLVGAGLYAGVGPILDRVSSDDYGVTIICFNDNIAEYNLGGHLTLIDFCLAKKIKCVFVRMSEKGEVLEYLQPDESKASGIFLTPMFI